MTLNEWLTHDEILIMDNAAKHTGREANILEDL